MSTRSVNCAWCITCSMYVASLQLFWSDGMHVVGVSVYTPTLYRTGWVSLIPACALMQHIAMWCTGVCCLVVATTMLLECTSNKYISIHSPASDQKGKSSSSQPPAKRSRQVSLMPVWWMRRSWLVTVPSTHPASDTQCGSSQPIPKWSGFRNRT